MRVRSATFPFARLNWARSVSASGRCLPRSRTLIKNVIVLRAFHLHFIDRILYISGQGELLVLVVQQDLDKIIVGLQHQQVHTRREQGIRLESKKAVGAQRSRILYILLFAIVKPDDEFVGSVVFNLTRIL